MEYVKWAKSIYTLSRLFSRMETFVHLIERSKNDLLRVYLDEHGFEIAVLPIPFFREKNRASPSPSSNHRNV